MEDTKISGAAEFDGDNQKPNGRSSYAIKNVRSVGPAQRASSAVEQMATLVSLRSVWCRCLDLSDPVPHLQSLVAVPAAVAPVDTSKRPLLATSRSVAWQGARRPRAPLHVLCFRASLLRVIEGRKLRAAPSR